MCVLPLCCVDCSQFVIVVSKDARALITSLPAARAGMFLHGSMKLKWLIETEQLQPILGQGLIPLCSTQYRLLFGTTRIPGKTMGKE